MKWKGGKEGKREMEDGKRVLEGEEDRKKEEKKRKKKMKKRREKRRGGKGRVKVRERR